MKLQELQNLRNIVKQDNQKEAMLFLLEEMIKLRAENNMLNNKIAKVQEKVKEKEEELHRLELDILHRDYNSKEKYELAERTLGDAQELLNFAENRLGDILAICGYRYFDLLVKTNNKPITGYIEINIPKIGQFRIFQSQITGQNFLNKYRYLPAKVIHTRK